MTEAIQQGVFETKLGKLKGCSYTHTDILKILTEIPEDQIAIKTNLAGYCNKELALSKNEFKQIWKDAHPKIKPKKTTLEEFHLVDDEEEGKVYRSKLSDDTDIILHPDSGICLEKCRVTQDEVKIDIVNIYKWEQFKIDLRFKYANSTSEKWHYRYSLNGLKHFDETFEEIAEKLNSCYQGLQGKSVYSNVLKQFLNDAPDRTNDLAAILGFDVKGWNLPPGKIFSIREETMLTVHHRMKKILETPMDLVNVKKIVQNIYQTTGIQHKDIIFAYIFIGPFLYAIRSFTQLLPQLSLGGLPGKGKSTITDVARKGYGNTEQLIPCSTMNSLSRAEGYLASSTIPIFIDDAEDLIMQLVGILKSMTTLGGYFQRKGDGAGKQYYTVNSEYCAPSVPTFNQYPEYYKDGAYRQRCIHIDLNKLLESKEFMHWYDALPEGGIFRCLYEFTKTWDITNLRAIYDDQNTMGFDKDQGRERKIVKILKIGVWLAKAIFDLDLNLTGLVEMIQDTRGMSLGEVAGLIDIMIDNSCYVNMTKPSADLTDYGVIQTTVCSNYKNIHWMHSPVRTGVVFLDKADACKTEGYGFDITNLRDLQQELQGNTKTKWSTNFAYQYVQPIYPHCKDGFYYLETYNETTQQTTKQRATCLFIPKADIEEYHKKHQIDRGDE